MALGALIGAGISTLGGIYAANKAKVEPLSVEDYDRMNRNSFQALIDYVPGLVDLDRKTAPQMTANELNRTQRLLEGSGGQEGLLDISERATPRINEQNIASNRQFREADLADVEANAGRVRSSIEAENRGLFDAIDAQAAGDPLQSRLTSMAMDDLGHREYADQLEGPGVHQLHELRQTALDDVGRGGRLSGEQLRDVQQYSRAADNSRGVLRSGMSVGNEVLNTERARKENLAFADQRLSNMEGALNSTRGRQIALRDHLGGFAQGVSNSNFQRGQTNIQNRLATFIDPFQGVLGRQSVNQSTTGGLFGQSNFNNQQSTRPNFMNDFNAMSGAMATNLMNSRIATGNNNAGIAGGLFSAAGNILRGSWGTGG